MQTAERGVKLFPCIAAGMKLLFGLGIWRPGFNQIANFNQVIRPREQCVGIGGLDGPRQGSRRYQKEEHIWSRLAGTILPPARQRCAPRGIYFVTTINPIRRGSSNTRFRAAA
jgi:hypothetical protein